MMPSVAAISIANRPAPVGDYRGHRNREREEQHADHLQDQEFLARIASSALVPQLSENTVINLPAILSGCSWITSVSGTPKGHSNGSGSAINQALTLPAGSSVTYTVNCTPDRPTPPATWSTPRLSAVPAGTLDVGWATTRRPTPTRWRRALT